MYRKLVVVLDLVVTALVLAVGSILIGAEKPDRLFHGSVAVVTGIVLVGSLLGARAWRSPILECAVEEFRVLIKVVVGVGVVLALTALAFGVEELRPWVFGALPVVGLALMGTRYMLRQGLYAQRARDRYLHPVLVAGDADEVAELIDRTRRERRSGWVVTGVCLSGSDPRGRPETLRHVPVLGGLDDVAAMAARGGFRVVALTPDVYWNRQRLRRLAWDLEDTPADLVLAPALMDVAGPRLRVFPSYGVTLLHVSRPRFSGGRWIIKAVLDRLAAAAGLVLLTPLLLAIALAIKLEDGGPVLFRQRRIGRAGGTFSMLKFRSMVVDAERRRGELVAANEASGPLFKIRRDPRVTRVGALLRRYSLDELPQLVNVLRGQMSLVGPRPPLPEEVEQYGYDALRRLLVKPGLTGLWQVSGRSELSWEETVRLDLRYVENWSLTMDAVIVWKTLAAVLSGRGAY